MGLLPTSPARRQEENVYLAFMSLGRIEQVTKNELNNFGGYMYFFCFFLIIVNSFKECYKMT